MIAATTRHRGVSQKGKKFIVNVAESERGDLVHVSVAGDSYFFSPDQIQEVFEAFKRAEQESKG